MRTKNLKINIWGTDFRVIVSNKMINKIKKQIKSKGGPIKLFRKTGLTSTIYYRILDGKGIRVKNYQKIIDYLNMGEDEAEKEIIGLTYNGSKFIYPYINKLDPLLFRIISHVLGDGSIASKNTCRWIQHNKNSHWLSKLIKKKIGFLPTSIKKEGNANMITISAYFSRLAKYFLGLKTKDLKNKTIIEKTNSLDKDYKLQLLTAFIVDEGHIRWDGAKSLIISQKDKKIMESLSKLLNNLNYDRSEIKEEIDKNNPSHIIHRINIYVGGVLKYNRDLDNQIKKFGKYAGLWHKQDSLNNYIKTTDPNPKHSKKQIDFINNHINKIIKRLGYVSYDVLRKDKVMKPFLSRLSKGYLINKFYYKVKGEELIRMENGLYKPANLNSNFFSDKK